MSINKRYIAIDLKSFYASVECVERGLDPLDTCLVVADESRTEKTICLAVSPALKQYGTGGRPRLFEVVQKVKEANRKRGGKGKSFSAKELKNSPEINIDYIVAKPRMQLYIDYSARIYEVYLKFIAPEDMHVYSIDEIFIDATTYLKSYGISAHELAMKLIQAVLSETGITATAGIGSNLYLSKVAMDIMAKKQAPDKDGVRIAELDEFTYRRELWDHQPLTDFWRVGNGIAKRLKDYDIMTMGDIARLSLNDENLLYGLFGVNAELLIDHAWGWEPVTMKEIKSYHPQSKSLSSGQVLKEPYDTRMAKTVVMEMTDSLSFELIEKGLVTDQLVLTIGYDSESLKRENIKKQYKGVTKKDFYGREVPASAHGSINIPVPTSSSKILLEKVDKLYDRIVNPLLLVRRLTLSANRLIDERNLNKEKYAIQLDLFSDYNELIKKNEKDKKFLEKERRRQETLIKLRNKFGKNIILKGFNFADGATQKDRNQQIGGHNA